MVGLIMEAVEVVVQVKCYRVGLMFCQIQSILLQGVMVDLQESVFVPLCLKRLVEQASPRLLHLL